MGCPVAIKVVAPQGNSTDSPVELAVLRGVRHPHVVRLVEDIGLPGGAVALVLERASGGSLARVVDARGHLTPAETVTVLTALATTLVDLHRMGVTHGDISPGNVLFHADGRPVLADLGVSHVAATHRTEAWGTDGFVDPAVLAGEAAGASVRRLRARCARLVLPGRYGAGSCGPAAGPERPLPGGAARLGRRHPGGAGARPAPPDRGVGAGLRGVRLLRCRTGRTGLR